MRVLEMTGVEVDLDGRRVLDGVTWNVDQSDRWVVLGPNGSGKTTLMRLASLYLHPTRGELRVLGERLGATDVRLLRKRIGLVSAGLANLLRPGATARDVVMAGRNAALETWWDDYTSDDERRAEALLARFGVGAVASSAFGRLSSGERQRVLLARALINDPELLLLDEPMAGLDLGGREQLVASLDGLAADSAAPPLVLVTHHLEEIPPAITHALLVSDGRIASAGPIADTLTSSALSSCFSLPVEVTRDAQGRFRLGGG